ncbi:hypothetical protein [Aromatoleum evansii]|uniref:hypothetical protein n=1 Tax=Aromatoleum evansii TaxID=59406 RepID=UPI00145D0688|nr:hypothetical protein [Aromatoleum evansii]NMG30614.1 hypothetical protein [Aromatoleum evansii]
MTTSNYSIPTSTLAAQELLSVLQLPTLDANTIRAIGQKEGMEFKQALVDAANQAPNAEARMKYLKALLTACAPLTRDTIGALGFAMPDLGALIDLSKQEGHLFAGAVRGMRTENADPASLEAARNYLKRTLRTICEPLPAGNEAPARAPQAEHRPAQPASSGLHNPGAPTPPPDNVAQLPRREPSNAPAATGEAEGNGRKFVSFHLYGGKAAMCFSLNTTRKGNFPTVQIEAAAAKGEKVYDWDKKISFQLTIAELPLVFGVLFGFSSRIELSGHGATNDKALIIEDQGNKFFMSMRVRGGGTFALPVLPKDTYAIMAMIFGQMKANNPELSDTQLMMLARRVCEKTATPAQAPARAANG